MRLWVLTAALGAVLTAAVSTAHASSFTYHGSLQEAGQPANGQYDLQLTLYSQKDGGNVLAGPITVYGVEVTDGNFVTPVDFGAMAPLSGQGWVDVQVKPAGESQFTALDVRSPVTPDGSCPGSWTLDGNAGLPAGSYLGTADNSSVIVRANGGIAAYFNPGGAVGLAYPDGAEGSYSTAIGYHAETQNAGSVMIGGFSDNFSASIRDTAANQFIVASAGGIGLETSAGATGGPLLDELTLAPSPNLPGSNADFTMLGGGTSNYKGFNLQTLPGGYYAINGLYYDGSSLFYDRIFYINYIHGSTSYGEFALNGANSTAPFAVGTSTSNGNGAFLSGTGVWTNASSRTWKDGFAKINPLTVLQKLVSMPVQTWYYKGNHDDGQHMGPVAEDFAKAFGLGENEKYIGTVDESGVALAAIQGLNDKVEKENTVLRQQNTALQDRLDRMSARLDKLESHGGR